MPNTSAPTSPLDTVDFNPYLARLRTAAPDENAKGAIERPGESPNIPWQTRAALPTEYENRLGDALEQVFESGATELADIAARLNDLGCLAPDNKPWTAERFVAAMRTFAR